MTHDANVLTDSYHKLPVTAERQDEDWLKNNAAGAEEAGPSHCRTGGLELPPFRGRSGVDSMVLFPFHRGAQDTPTVDLTLNRQHVREVLLRSNRKSTLRAGV